MEVLDYIIIGLAVAAFIYGIVRGLLKQILSLLGLFIIPPVTAALSGYPNAWLENIVTDEGWRSVISLVATFLVVSVVYILLVKLLKKIFHSVKTLGLLDRLLGAVFALAALYFVLAIVTSLLLDTEDWFLPFFKNLLGDIFKNSKAIQFLYGDGRNVVGNWLLDLLSDKFSQIKSQPQTEEAMLTGLLVLAAH